VSDAAAAPHILSNPTALIFGKAQIGKCHAAVEIMSYTIDNSRQMGIIGASGSS